jgi:hypothetical protein
MYLTTSGKRMWLCPNWWTCILVCLAAFLPSCSQDAAQAQSYEKRIMAAKWKWSDERANLLTCVVQRMQGYEVQITRPEDITGLYETLAIGILKGGKDVLRFQGHAETAIARANNVLYIAELAPCAPGCTILAYDLEARKELWRCPLRGTPPPAHSEYRNRVNVEADEDLVIVYGNESWGRYIEYVDAKTGKSVANRRLPQR